MVQTLEQRERYATRSFDKLFKSLLDNYEPSSSPKDQEGYLIIVDDSFYSQILPLATWKNGLGFDTTVTKTSEIPGGISTISIHNYIVDAYNTWNPPPSFVLLVGDTGQIPTYTGTETGSAADLYYVTINPGDYFPDIFIGRFPASSPAHVTTMVEKILTYEQETYPSAEFLIKSAFMASVDNYDVSEGSHNYCIDTHLEPNGWINDKLYQVTYGATTQDVRNSLNDGRILAVYSGHGSTTGWSDGPPFSQSDVNGLTNHGMYSFVCSHACLTGQFTEGECFGETWVRADDKAGMTFWGSSTYTYWDEDDILERNMFDAWWIDEIGSIGGMTDEALYEVYQYYSGGGLSKYYFECYNILGDPSINLDTGLIWEDDVGVIDIITPSETTPEGLTTVSATVENFGLNDQVNVPVTCDIYEGGDILFIEDFEDDNGGMIPGGTSIWEWGIPTYGPGSAHSGSKCWATRLNSDYVDNANAYVDTQPIILPSDITSQLSFWHWYEIESVTYSTAWDGGDVEISVNRCPQIGNCN